MPRREVMNGAANRVCEKCGGIGYEMDWYDLGQSYKEARVSLGLSLRQLGEKCSVSAMHISDMERGNRTWNGAAGRRVANYLTKKMKWKR